jgi:hypothetical protein
MEEILIFNCIKGEGARERYLREGSRAGTIRVTVCSWEER